MDTPYPVLALIVILVRAVRRFKRSHLRQLPGFCGRFRPRPSRTRSSRCQDQALTKCAPTDTGTALQYDLPMSRGTIYLYVTAWWYDLVVDGIPQGQALESGKSNVLRVDVQIPPGNPSNARIRVSTVANTESGQRIK